MNIITKEASIAAPICALDATGKTGVFRYDSLTTNQSVAIPAGLYGNFIRVFSFGCDTDVAVSKNAAQTLVRNQVSALGVGHAAAGWTIPNGSYIDFIVPTREGQSNVTHYLNFISSAASAWVLIYMSEALSVGRGG